MKTVKFLAVLFVVGLALFVAGRFFSSSATPILIVAKPGVVTSSPAIQTAVQHNSFAEILETKGKLLLMPKKGKILVKWDSQVRFGVVISESNPIRWEIPDVAHSDTIVIHSPRLSVLSAALSLADENGKKKFEIFDIDKAMGIPENKIHDELPGKLEGISKLHAESEINDPQLLEISKIVIRDHILGIINQAQGIQPVTKASVVFDGEKVEKPFNLVEELKKVLTAE